MRLLFIYGLIFLQILFGSSKVGIAVKVAGEVKLFSSETSAEAYLNPGKPLNNDDRITTGDNSFTAVMYLDDKTLVKVMENSELTIRGSRGASGINKEIDISYGKLSAKVAKQKGNEFRISTPTSVASVKGTDLLISSDPSEGDSFVLIEGLIEVTNSITGETTQVKKGETATSNPDGTLNVSETTENDLEGFQEEETIQEGPQELRFEIQDENGNIKQIIIQIN
jgi:hypothetical protein